MLKKKNSYFWRFLFLKQAILKKRNYIYNNEVEKHDLLFDAYRDSIMKKFLQFSELDRYSLKSFLRKKRFRIRFFLKIYRRGLVKLIKNEILILAPELLFLHKKAKSWKILKNKRKRRKLKNIKKIVLHYFPNYRESCILKEQLDRTYFWLVNTTKRQVMSTIKLNKLRKTSNIVENYYRIKFSLFRKRQIFLKKKKNLFLYFSKVKKLIYIKIFKLYISKLMKNMLLFCLFLQNNYFKFFFFKYFKIFSLLFKKTILNKSIIDSLNISFSEFFLLRKRRFKVRRKTKRKLRFYYNLYTRKKEIYKLKVKMLNSNFFITLTDYNNRVLLSRSTGQVSENRKKKVKLSPYLVIKMMYPILSKLKKKKIKFLFLFINSKINRHINNVIKCLKNNYHTKILKVFFSKPIAHHIGTRKPKLRRL